MANNVRIDGTSVDIDDPCAYCAALRRVLAKIITGQSVSEISVQDFNGQRRTRFQSFLSDRTALEREIARQQDLCTQSTGGRKSRFAIRAGFSRIP